MVGKLKVDFFNRAKERRTVIYLKVAIDKKEREK
jgi:hypothetical protein